jgi:hypothetical protein
VTGECESLVEGNPKAFYFCGPWDRIAPNPDVSSWQFPWRPTSGEIYCLGLGRVDFYLPLLEVRGMRIEVSLQYIANHTGISAGHKNRCIIRKYGNFTLVALGRISFEEIE